MDCLQAKAPYSINQQDLIAIYIDIIFGQPSGLI